MSFGLTATLVSIVTILLGLAATRDLELRPFRWLKIALTLPIVLYLTFVFRNELERVTGYFAIFSFAILAVIWKSSMAHFGSLAVGRLIYGDMTRPTGIQADFSGPKALRKHGDLAEAIALAQQELEKEPHSYEGLLLLADLYLEADEQPRALKTMEKLLGNADLTKEQRDLVQARKEKIEEWELLARLNQR